VPRYLHGRAVSVTQPSDATERHADSIADHVMSSASCPACARGLPCTTCGAGSDRAPIAPVNPASHVSFPDAGRPLDGDTRRFFEPRFGRDLSGVRIHASERDGALARSFAARAFTTGSDIVFAPGAYAPGTDAGRGLIAHELAHVVRPAASGTIAREPDSGATGGGAADSGVADTGASAGPTDAGVAPLPAGVPPAPPPVLFDSRFGACATEEEGRRRDAFALRYLHIERNIPSTTHGMFDAGYFPFAGLMPVTVKIKFNFVSADNAPNLFAAAWRALGGEDVSRFFWSDTEKADFKRDYISRIVARWSAKFTMTSTKPCWAFTAVPLVTPLEVDTDDEAHFVATVHKSPGPGIDYKSITYLPDMAHPERPSTATLYSSDVQEEPDFGSPSVATSERQRIEAALTAAGASPVLFEKDKDVITPAARTALTAFADALKQKNPSDPLIPLKVDGFASSEGDATRNTTLADGRAVAVRNLLSSLGVPQPIGVLGHGAVGAPEDASNRKADITVDHAFETTYATNRYSVGEHEFGHMLGLPDEYQNNTTGALGTLQTNYSGLVTSAGVQGPAVWGVRTASQMSTGIDVLPRHYVTLWEALGRMTTPDITQAEWKLG
jgi:outer membrane protein OmpA-like peptidoglycan-associated protein